MNITLKEFMDQAQHVLSVNKVKTNEELILDAWVVGSNSYDYPEGTIIFLCKNIKDKETKKGKIKTHHLAILPKEISPIQ